MQFVEQTRWQRRRSEVTELVLRRILIAVPIVVLVSMGVFLLAKYSPFDPLVAYLGDKYERTTGEQRDVLAQALSLHQSWWSAWTQWVGDALRGDLGVSRIYGQPVLDVIKERLPWSLLLGALAYVGAVIVGTVLGFTAGLRPGSRLDKAIERFSISVQAIPPYVLSLGAVALFAVTLGWLPAGGATSYGDSGSVFDVITHVVLPASVLAVSQLPWLVLSLRASVHEALSTDAVRNAVARGIPRRVVFRGHVLPVSLAPLVTLMGARLPELIVGSVIVEETFGWPGLGASMVNAARELDFPLLVFLTTATTGLVLIGSLITDAIYLLLDPRVKHHD